MGPGAPPSSRRRSAIRSRTSGRSTLLTATICGLLARSGLYAASSPFTCSRSPLTSADVPSTRVQEEACALGMPQELKPKSNAAVGALHQPRHLCGDVSVLLPLDNRQDRLRGGERMGRHPWPGRGYGREEARLAGVRPADDADVREKLQSQAEMDLLPSLARLGKERHPVRRPHEPPVPPPATSAVGNKHVQTNLREVRQQMLLPGRVDLHNLRPLADGDNQVFPILSPSLRPSSSPSTMPYDATPVPKGLQCRARQPFGHPQVDIPAMAAVTAVRAATRHKLLPAEGD